MLGRKTFTRDEFDAGRAATTAQLDALDQLPKTKADAFYVELETRFVEP